MSSVVFNPVKLPMSKSYVDDNSNEKQINLLLVDDEPDFRESACRYLKRLGFYVEEDLDPGDEVIIRNYGVSEQFYEFMFVLLQQTSEGGGPFETQPATVRGNCINTTSPNNYPLGYFRLSEVSEIVYTVEN